VTTDTGTVSDATPSPDGAGPYVRKNLMLESTFEPQDFLAGWDNLQHCCAYSLTQSTDRARQGTHSIKIDLRSTDAIVSSSVRSELTQKQDDSAETMERWYGMSYWLDNHASDTGGESILQWHDTDGTCPPLSIQIYGTQMLLTQCINGGNTTNDIGQVASNVWIDIVMHVKWSAGQTGALELWRDGKKLVDKTGIRTNSTGGSYIKVGMNKWSWAPNGGASNQTQRLFYIDEVRIGSEKATYADVKPGD
jgi:hypothetical protein